MDIGGNTPAFLFLQINGSSEQTLKLFGFALSFGLSLGNSDEGYVDIDFALYQDAVLAFLDTLRSPNGTFKKLLGDVAKDVAQAQGIK